MKVIRVITITGCLALSACVTQTSESPTLGGASTASTRNEETTERARARIHTELAANYYEIGNMGVALEEIKEAIRSDGNYGPAYNVAALVYARLREDRLAEESFQRALRIDGNDHDANNNYGQFLCERKREKESIKYFLAAVRNPLYPLPDRSYVNAGVCSRRGGDVAAAEQYFQMALKYRPTQPQALYNLAEISYLRNDWGGSKTYLSRLAQAGVDAPDVLWLGVRVVRKLGDNTTEASYARQLRNKYPNSPETKLLNAGQFE